ncbi:putative vacuolar protein sorting-associated protein 13B [Diplonema papillatum]|nr:putative vacuolar protein sorting-associated protein 13B [Diplonema papillatum]
MLERWVASIFSSYLGRYIKDLDKRELQVSMWSGEVVLHDLELVPEALDEFDLPVIIDRGIIGKLKIEIPWKNFYSKTCKVDISDVQLVVQPIKATEWNAQHEQKKQRHLKQTKVRVFEASRQPSKKDDEKKDEEDKKEGYGTRLARHVIASLRVAISDVTLRYEDCCTDPRRPVVWSVHLDELSVVPCDTAWVPTESNYCSGTRNFRTCSLKGLTLSIDHLPVAPRLTGDSKVSDERWRDIMRVAKTLKSQRCTQKPLDVQLKISTQPSSVHLDLNHPKTAIDTSISWLDINLKRWQYDAINRTARYLVDFSTLDKFRRYRPKAAVKNAPAAWWQFAFHCILLVQREQRLRTQVSWERLKKRKTHKERYIILYKKTQGLPWLKAPTEAETAEFEELEDQLTADAIIFFRRLAKFQIRVEQNQHKEKAVSETAPSGSWYQWWSGWTAAAPETVEADEIQNAEKVWKLLDADEWSPEQKKMLYEELGVADEGEGEGTTEDAASPARGDVPLSYIQTRIQFTVWKGTIEMCENEGTVRSAAELLNAIDVHPSTPLPPCLSATDLLAFDASMLTKYGLAQSRLSDYKNVFGLTLASAVAPSSPFAAVELDELTVRWQNRPGSWKAAALLKNIQLSTTSLATGSHRPSLIQKTGDKESHLFLATVQKTSATLNTAAAYDIDINVRAADAVVDVTWMQSVCAFWGVGVYGSCSDLEASGKLTPQEIAEARTQQHNMRVQDPVTALKMSLERETSVTLSFMMDSPCLVIPADCDDLSSIALVITADAFSVSTDEAKTAGRQARQTFVDDDYFNHYLVKSNYGRIMTTTISKWSSMVDRDYDTVCQPLVVDAVINLNVLVSLIPKCAATPKVCVTGRLPNLVLRLSRSGMLAAEKAFTSLLDFASNVTGRGSINVTRSEDDTSGSCSTFVSLLGPMPKGDMTLSNHSPVRQYAELDSTTGHLRLYDIQRSSKVATLIDLSSGEFDISEPSNALALNINGSDSLWVQLPTESMHRRWLRTLQQIQAKKLVPIAPPASIEDSSGTQQEWLRLNVSLGDMKLLLEKDDGGKQCEAVFPSSSVRMWLTGHDTRFELMASSLAVSDKESVGVMWSGDGDPGISIWFLNFTKSSRYFDPQQTQKASTRIGFWARGISLNINTNLIEAVEMAWDLLCISWRMASNTEVFTARREAQSDVVMPPQMPKPFEQRQGANIVCEVDGDVEVTCYSPEAEPVFRIRGEDCSFQFFDTPYGLVLDGHLLQPFLEDISKQCKYSRFLDSTGSDCKSRVDFEYVNLRNRGALMGDVKPARPSHFHGLSFIQQLNLALVGVEITYFQTFLWTLLEYMQTGLLHRLTFCTWRSVFDGSGPVSSPYNSYNPATPPSEPYYDLLKYVIECSDCHIVLPSHRNCEAGVMHATAATIGISNDLVKTDNDDVLFHTTIHMSGMDIEVPEEFCDEVPSGKLFHEPQELVLESIHSMTDPYQRHPQTKLVFTIPFECTMFFSEGIYCSFLTWLTKSLMEPWTPKFAPAAPAPLPYKKLCNPKRYNNFTYEFVFKDLSLCWIESQIPSYTMRLSATMILKWFTNTDFETLIAAESFSIVAGVDVNDTVVKALPMVPDSDEDRGPLLQCAMVWTTPEAGCVEQKKMQCNTLNINGKLHVTLDHIVLLSVADSLISSKAQRSGGFALLGWVEPEEGWPAAGEPWPATSPPDYVIVHTVKVSGLEVAVPNACTLLMNFDSQVLQCPGGACNIEATVPGLHMTDWNGKDMITMSGDSAAFEIKVSRGADDAGWEKAVGRVGTLKVVVSVMSFSALYEWCTGLSLKLLMNVNAPSAELRLKLVQQTSSQHSQKADSPDSKSDTKVDTLLLPEFDLAWSSPKLEVLCSSSSRRGFLFDFGEMKLFTSKDEKSETVTASLVGYAVQNIHCDTFVVKPTKVDIVFRRTEPKQPTELRALSITGSAMEAFLTFSDVRTIAAAANEYSQTLKTARKARIEERDAYRQRAPQAVQSADAATLLALARADAVEGEGSHGDRETLSFDLHLPLLSLSILSGGTEADDLRLPPIAEPHVRSTISFADMTGRFSRRTTGKTSFNVSLHRFGIDSPTGPLLLFERSAFSYKQAVGQHGDQSIDLDFGAVSIVIVPEYFFGVMNFVYLPYAAATMPDTFAAPDVIDIDTDLDLTGDLVLNRDKMLHISGRNNNLIRINGHNHELHLVGDKPLIRIDAGVTLEIVATKLYLYNKPLKYFVQADDGAYVHAPADRTDIDHGVPPITAWSQKEKKDAVPETVTISAQVFLTVVLPGVQEDPEHGIVLTSRGEGFAKWIAKGKETVKEEASLSLKDFTIRPRLSNIVHATSLLESVECIKLTLQDSHFLLVASDFHFRLSSADAALMSRAMTSLQNSIAHISNQAKLKIGRDDEEIIIDAIVQSHQLANTPPVASHQSKTYTGEATLGVLDVLLVEDSGGFDIPLFFLQLLEIDLKAQSSVDLQLINLANATLCLDYYNLENCEWESVILKPINCNGRFFANGPYKKDVGINISTVSALVTPQLIKTVSEGRKFGASFQPQTSLRPDYDNGYDARSVDLAPSGLQSTEFRLYEVINQTGYNLSFWYEGEADSLDVKNLETLDFNFGRKYGREVQHTISVSIEGKHDARLVDIGRVGTASLEIPHAGRLIKLFCTVKLTELGRKKVTFRSSVTVTNTTPVTLQITGLCAKSMMAVSGETVCIPHVALQESYLAVTPLLSDGYDYTTARLGLSYGSLYRLNSEVFVLTSRPILHEEYEDQEKASFPPEFTCFVEVSTDAGIDTAVMLLPVFTLENLTGLNMTFSVLTQDSRQAAERRSIKKLFRRERKGVSYDVVSHGALATDEVSHITSADPFHCMFLDVEIKQPTGEILRRSRDKFATPFVIRNPAKNHQNRCTSIVLSDDAGRQVHLSVEYSARKVSIYCPLWIINQTTYHLELAVHNPMKLADSSVSALTAGQTPGEGIKPGAKPFLMAPPDMAEKEHIGHLYCRILGHTEMLQWSAKTDVSKVGAIGTIECAERSGALPRTIAFSVEFPWGKVATRTKVIRFTPRWIVCNRTPKPVMIRHEVRGAGVPGQPRPKSEFQVHPQNTYQEYEGGSCDNFMAVKNSDTESTKSRFCKPFPIDRMGETDVTLKYTVHTDRLNVDGNAYHSTALLFETMYRSGEGMSPDAADTTETEVKPPEIEEFDVVRVAIFLRGSIIYVTLDSLEAPPYVIENRTPVPLFVKQKTDSASALRFPPRTTKPFSWEFQERDKILVVQVGDYGCQTMVVNLDPKSKDASEASMQECKTNTLGTVFLRVRHRNNTTKVSLTMDNEIDQWFAMPPLSVQFKGTVNGLGVALLRNGTELANLSMQLIQLSRKREENKIVYVFRIGTVQLDDQNTKAEYPVVLANKIPKDRAPFVLISIHRRVNLSSAAIHVERCSVRFQPLEAKFHDRFLFSLLSFYRASLEKIVTSGRQKAAKYYTAPLVDASVQTADHQDGISTRPLYLELLQIDSININASLIRSGQDRDKDFFKNVLGYLAVFVRGFEDMALVWPKVVIDQHCNKAWLVATMLKDKYTSETTGQLLRVAPGVATVHTFVTDLLATLPAGKSEPIEYQTPRKRIREPARLASLIVETASTATSVLPTGSAPPTFVPSDRSRSSVDVSAGVASPDKTFMAFFESVVSLKSEDEASHSLMSKTRAADVLALKKKSWEKFHPNYGRTTWEEYCQACAWNEFHAHTTENEFKAHVDLALDQHIRDFLADPAVKSDKQSEICRCKDVLFLKEKMGKRGLQPPHDVSSKAIRLSWYEFAHHTTWEEFKQKTTESEFYQYVHFARDCCLGLTHEFKKLNKTEAATMFRS